MVGTPRVVEINQGSRSLVNNQTKENFSPEAGKNFPSLMLEAQSEFMERSEKICSKNDPEAEKNTKLLESIQEVVDKMGLSYFFTILKDSDIQNTLGFQKASKLEISIDLKEASSFLAEIGFSPDMVEKFLNLSTDENKINLEEFLNLLKEIQPQNPIKGESLNKLISSILINGESLMLNLQNDKEFSPEELKHIMNNLEKILKEGKNLQSHLFPSEEATPSQEIEKPVFFKTLSENFAKETVYKLNTGEVKAEAKPQNIENYIFDISSSNKSMEFDQETIQNLEKVEVLRVSKEHQSLNLSQDGLSQNFFGNSNNQPFQDNLPNNFFIASPSSLSSQQATFNHIPTISKQILPSQLAEHITNMIQLNQNQIVLQLEPKELGLILVRVKAESNRISTSISVETVEAKELLQKNSDILRSYLLANGLVLDEFSVETSLEGQKEFAGKPMKENRESPEKGVKELNNILGLGSLPRNVERNNHLIYFYA